MRFGIRAPLAAGLGLASVGLVLFARAPVEGSFAVDVLPAMILLGFGAGIAFNPMLLAAMSDVAPEESGLASGVVNTAFMMGGALGLAILASLAASRVEHARGSRRESLSPRSTAAITPRSSSERCLPASAAAIGGIFLRTSAATAGYVAHDNGVHGAQPAATD